MKTKKCLRKLLRGFFLGIFVVALIVVAAVRVDPNQAALAFWLSIVGFLSLGYLLIGDPIFFRNLDD